MPRIRLLPVAALAAVVAAPAFAQPPQKISCTPATMTECESPGQCKTREASDDDKQEKLIIDFAAKKSTTQGKGEDKPFGDLIADKTEDGKRVFSIKFGEGADEIVALTLDADGTLRGTFDKGKYSFTARCVAAN